MTSTLVARRHFLAGSAASLITVASARRTQAQSYPTRPVRWICYQAAGGSMDLTLRAYQPILEKRGIRTQIEYVTGGSGSIARTQTFTAPPDGYTIMMDTAPGSVMGEVVLGAAYKALSFQPIFGWSIEGWQFCT